MRSLNFGFIFRFVSLPRYYMSCLRVYLRANRSLFTRTLRDTYLPSSGSVVPAGLSILMVFTVLKQMRREIRNNYAMKFSRCIHQSEVAHHTKLTVWHHPKNLRVETFYSIYFLGWCFVPSRAIDAITGWILSLGKCFVDRHPKRKGETKMDRLVDIMVALMTMLIMIAMMMVMEIERIVIKMMISWLQW